MKKTATTLKIDKGVKVPSSILRPGRPSKYEATAQKMKKGDSVLVDSYSIGQNISKAIKKAHGIDTFVTCRMTEEGDVRVWRLS